jgi:hypothetical protein
MIESFKLRFGRSPGVMPELIRGTQVTVFVGPNYSGKSKVLAEIGEFCRSGNRKATDVILDTVTFTGFPRDDVENQIRRMELKPRPGESIQEQHLIVGKKGHRQHARRDILTAALLNPMNHTYQFCNFYLSHNTLMLDGRNRINLVTEDDLGDLQYPQKVFQVLFADDAKRQEVRRIIYEAFGLYLVLDPTNGGRLRLRLSRRAPSTPIEERGLHSDAVSFHSQATPIELASDGVKAFTGLISEIIAGDPMIVLIDEPEAFLHPSLASNLGKEIAKGSVGSSKRIFISTHSANFVMGCIQSGQAVSIIRLTYRDEVATARVLPNEDLLRLMRNPLLRSVGIIAALFYEFVVVTEADTDRAFYHEINERLLNYNQAGGIPNCLFANAQNKQTVRSILRPLRELGIPAAGIVDIDILKDGGTNWTEFLHSGNVPQLEHQSLGALRHSIYERLLATGKDMKKDGGIGLLQGQDREAANNLLEKLAEYGLFVVQNGEVESWLKPLNVQGHGPNWLISMFEKLGEDPESASYVVPAADDIWNFITQIRKWLTDPKRKGIPE